MSNDWIEWNGGECPVPPDTLVVVRERRAPEQALGPFWAKHIKWEGFRNNDAIDVVAYRVVDEIPRMSIEIANAIQFLKSRGYTVIEPRRTILVNGIEVPEPLREAPEDGATYWVVTFNRNDGVEYGEWNGDSMGNLWLQLGLCHHTEEAARTHFKALVEPSRRKE